MTDNEIKMIAEMQHKIDVYENFIVLCAGMIRREDPSVVCLASDLEKEDDMDDIWTFVKEKIEEGHGKV